MARRKDEYAVEVKTIGRATVFTLAESADEALDNVNNGDFYGGEPIEWSVDDATYAEVNK